ncbi:MAG: type II toxin-antitoxin system PemK/MazF family toxin [Actinomycetaceae bacterium]|nr:type II toxin-antitoxin system PemK/MazF family toxin [Actinomycetaceae bacterium]
MRDICLAKLDKTRPVLVLTRWPALQAMTKVTVAPITTICKGLSSEVPLGKANGLDQECVAAIDNCLTIPKALLGPPIGALLPSQEADLARAIILAFDLDIPLTR